MLLDRIVSHIQSIDIFCQLDQDNKFILSQYSLSALYESLASMSRLLSVNDQVIILLAAERTRRLIYF